jgi:hypothetical protein
LSKVKFQSFNFLDWGAEIRLKDLGLFTDERAVEGLNDRYIASAMLCPLIRLYVIGDRDFGPVSIKQDFKLGAEISFVVGESDEAVRIVTLVLNAIEKIEVLAGGPETSDGPLVS